MSQLHVPQVFAAVVAALATLSLVSASLAQQPATMGPEAVDIIAALEDARAGTEQLQNFVRPTHPPVVRARALLALARNGSDTQALGATLKRGLLDRDNDVRRMAAFAVGQLGDEAHAGLLLDRVRIEPERAVVREIWRALGRVGGAPALDTAQRSPRWYRAWAIEASGLIARRLKKAPWDVPVIAAGLRSTDPATLAAALYAVSRGHFKLGPDWLRDVAVAGLSAKDARVRAEAARALSGARFKDLSLQDLAPAVSKLPPHHVAWMLRGWKDDGGVKGALAALLGTAKSVDALVSERYHRLVASLTAARVAESSAQGNGQIWFSQMPALSQRAKAPARRRRQALECFANPVLAHCLTGGTGAPSEVISKGGRRRAETLLGGSPTAVKGPERLRVLQAVARAWKAGDAKWLKRRESVLKRALDSKDGPVAAFAADQVAKSSLKALTRHVVAAQERFGDNVEVAADLLKARVRLDPAGAKVALARAAGSKERAMRLLASKLTASLSTAKGSETPTFRPSADPRPLVLDAEAARKARTSTVVGAWLHTDVGDVAVRLYPKVAPRTVANFVTLSEKGYYDGIRFHRVVPGFVVQAGDPRGDGWGGPGYTIRCENNPVPYGVGSLGMALAGKDTGGSQWFITLQRQPHLMGTYSVFGQVASGMSIVKRIAQGDVIRRVTVVRAGDVGSKGAPWIR